MLGINNLFPIQVCSDFLHIVKPQNFALRLCVSFCNFPKIIPFLNKVNHYTVFVTVFKRFCHHFIHKFDFSFLIIFALSDKIHLISISPATFKLYAVCFTSAFISGIRSLYRTFAVKHIAERQFFFHTVNGTFVAVCQV